MERYFLFSTSFYVTDSFFSRVSISGTTRSILEIKRKIIRTGMVAKPFVYGFGQIVVYYYRNGTPYHRCYYR